MFTPHSVDHVLRYIVCTFHILLCSIDLIFVLKVSLTKFLVFLWFLALRPQISTNENQQKFKIPLGHVQIIYFQKLKLKVDMQPSWFFYQAKIWTYAIPHESLCLTQSVLTPLVYKDFIKQLAHKYKELMLQPSCRPPYVA